MNVFQQHLNNLPVTRTVKRYIRGPAHTYEWPCLWVQLIMLNFSNTRSQLYYDPNMSTYRTFQILVLYRIMIQTGVRSEPFKYLFSIVLWSKQQYVQYLSNTHSQSYYDPNSNTFRTFQILVLNRIMIQTAILTVPFKYSFSIVLWSQQ